jgi:hypothetical protein
MGEPSYTGNGTTIAGKMSFQGNPSGADQLVLSAPQDDPDACGGMCLAYVLVRAGAVGDATAVQAVIKAGGNIPSAKPWGNFAANSMFPDDLVSLGNDLYQVANLAFSGSGGLSPQQVVRFITILRGFGALGAAFDMQMWKSAINSNDGHWILNHNVKYISSQPLPSDASHAIISDSTQAVLGGSTVQVCIVSAKGDGSVVLTDTRPGQGGSLTVPKQSVSQDKNGFQQADNAAKGVVGTG